MSIITNKRKKGTTYTAIIRKGSYRKKPLKQTFLTKGEAKFWKLDQERLIDMKKHQDPRLADRVTLNAALDKYATYGRTILKKAPSTLDREIYSQRHLERLIGKNTPLSEINATVMSNYQSERIFEEASTSSIRQELAIMSKMFRIAKNIWLLPVDNPLENVDRVKPDKGRERFLSEKEASRIIAETKNSMNKKFYPFVLLLMHTGMRTGEAARLTVDSIDLDRRLLTIRETKTNTPRTVGASQDVIDALKDIEPEPDGYYFLKPHHRKSKSTMMRPGCIFRECWLQLWKRIERDHNSIKRNSQITHFKPHDIRHTAASHLLKQNIDIRIIADILGHATLQMVMRYTHLFDDSKVEYADKISYLGAEEND